MTKILIIGASGSLGTALRQRLSGRPEYRVTLFSRRAQSLKLASNERAINGSASSAQDLDTAVEGQDLVFVALSGDLPAMAQQIIAAMKRKGVERLIFVASMGIYGEVAGEPAGVVPEVLRPYREAADLVEASGLHTTILRPGWFDNGSDTDIRVSRRGETFTGHDVSRAAIAQLVQEMIDRPELYDGENLGLHR